MNQSRSFRIHSLQIFKQVVITALIIGLSSLFIPYPTRAQDDPPPPPNSPSISILVQEASLILIGQAVAVSSQLSTNSFNDQLIISDITISIQEVLKGSLSISNLVLQDVPGGNLSTISMQSSNDPYFITGERVVLFLESGPNGWQTVEGDMGKVTVDANGQVPAMGLSLAQLRVMIISTVNGWNRYLPIIFHNNPNINQSLGEQPASLQGIQQPNYVLDGKTWPGNPPVLTYAINNPGFNDPGFGNVQTQNNLIFLGLQAWSTVARANIALNNNPPAATNVNTVGNDQQNTVIIRNSFKPGDVNQSILATTYCFGNDNNQFTDCDIVFWDSMVFSPNGAANTSDLTSVSAHEFGHLVGLDHSGVNGSTVFATIFTGTTNRRTLHLDDMAGTIALYGARMAFHDQSSAGAIEAGDKFSEAFAAADFFNNVGNDDLAVGSPGEDYNGSGPNAGVVFLYNADANPAWSNPVVLTQSPAGSNEAGDRFGSELAAGDFNGDGFPDLAVGTPGENYFSSGSNAGVVYIFSGTGNGVANPVVLSQSGAGSNESGDLFGSSLAVADFNQDGFDDLAVGAPGENYQNSGLNAGVVFVFSGSDAGLGNPYVLDQAPADTNESNDDFGTALISGDFDSDNEFDDLAVGAPGEDYNGSGINAGLVFIFTSSNGPLESPRILTQQPYRNESGDKYGFALSAGDFDGDAAFDDLAVGAPGEDFAGSGPNAGVVFQFLNTLQANNIVYGQELAGSNEAGDLFGSSLATGDFNNDGSDELAIGAWGENYQGSGSSAGIVFILQFTDDSGGNVNQMMVLSQSPAGSNEATDQFGTELVILNNNAGLQLVIGAPGEDLNGSGGNAGAWFIWQ